MESKWGSRELEQEKYRYFGYVCPACGKSVLEGRSVFALRAAAAVIACGCGESELRVETDGKDFHLYVPCGVCGETHRAECPAERLLEGAGIGLACPESGEICCYVGEESRVEKALCDLEASVRKEKNAGEGDDAENFADSVVMYEVLSELREIAARERGITCGCGSARCRMQVRRSFVDLICADCGARLRVPAATEEDLDALCCHLRLKIPGAEAAR